MGTWTCSLWPETVLDCRLVWLHCGTRVRCSCWWREMKLTMCEDDIFPRHGGDEFFHSIIPGATTTTHHPPKTFNHEGVLSQKIFSIYLSIQQKK